MEWCASLGIALDPQTRPLLPSSFIHKTRWLYAEGGRSGRESGLASLAAQRLGSGNEVLLWIRQTGVWPSTEDWPGYYAMRGGLGERRSLEIAPGHLFGPDEAESLIEFLTATMENGWDAFAIANQNGNLGDVVVQISHDEWFDLHSTKPVSFGFAAV
jgi:hypothetical protein